MTSRIQQPTWIGIARWDDELNYEQWVNDLSKKKKTLNLSWLSKIWKINLKIFSLFTDTFVKLYNSIYTSLYRLANIQLMKFGKYSI